MSISKIKSSLVFSMVAFLSLAAVAAEEKAKQEPAKGPKVKIKHPVVDSDDYMGDYEGTIKAKDGTRSSIAAQVIPRGDGNYEVRVIEKFDAPFGPIAILDGKLSGNKIVFDDQAAIENDRFSGTLEGDKSGSFKMKKVVRLSPTLAKKPPKGAIILFDGTSTDQWLSLDRKTQATGPCGWKITDDGFMEIVTGAGWSSTKKEFADLKLHMEFRSPLIPKATGQARGNSGVYIQGRYEVQILDSYGLKGEYNECGGIYKIAVPKVNMCAPPWQWQSYDITFHAAEFNANGTKTSDARITVLHNGKTIHDDQILPTSTHVSPFTEKPGSGPIVLQDHGWPVQFRNIWVVEN